MTADCNVPGWTVSISQCIALSFVKNTHPLRCGFSSKLFDRLLYVFLFQAKVWTDACNLRDIDIARDNAEHQAGKEAFVRRKH